jgi:hypothetical protein
MYFLYLSMDRKIAPVVRKVLLQHANDESRDLAYWLSKTPQERIAAVTFLVSQSLKEGERMDKTKIVKRKLKDDAGAGL